MNDDAVGGNGGSFFHDQAVAQHQIFTVDLFGVAISNNLAFGLGEVFEFLEGIAAAGILVQGDRRDQHNSKHHKEAIPRISADEINGGCYQQQNEHGLFNQTF